MINSLISWTDNTFNPWSGCQKVSDGCKHCYAERLVGQSLWGPGGRRRSHSGVYWQRPDDWHEQALDEGRRIRVFCGSICDVFEDRADLVSPRQRLWRVVERTTALDWQLLTKRPQNISRMVPPWWMTAWPPHVWIGTSTENQEWADRRVAELLQIPAHVRFLSAEPLLAPIPRLPLDGIHWVIVGGESGPKARPMDPAWARDIRDQCAARGVAFFMKQMGGLRDKRDDLDQIPEDLRFRDFPRSNMPGVEAA